MLSTGYKELCCQSIKFCWSKALYKKWLPPLPEMKFGQMLPSAAWP